MNDGKKWVTLKDGRRIKVNDYMNAFIRQKGKDNTFIDKDGKIYEITRKEDDTGDISYGHIGLNDKEKEVAWLEYTKLNNINADNDYKFMGTKYQIFGIKVEENYRRKGLGTRLYKEIGKMSNYKEIKFGSLTEDGKKLVESVATITKVIDYAGGTLYFGKIKENKK